MILASFYPFFDIKEVKKEALHGQAGDLKKHLYTFTLFAKNIIKK